MTSRSWLALLLACAPPCLGQADTATARLLNLEPTIVVDPLQFSSLPGLRLPLVSQRAVSWTATQFSFQGTDATDAYQPGRMVVFPDTSVVSDVAVRSGSQVAMLAPEAGSSWRFHVSTGGTGSALASDNLPPSAVRGILKQSEHYRWFSRNDLKAGGPVGKRADLLLAATGQWASQIVPRAEAGKDLNSRLLSGLVRGRVQVTGRDQFDAQFSESRLWLSNWGIPAGLEALAGRRMSPSFSAPGGFAGLSERDNFASVQTGWTRKADWTLDVRYGFSLAHLETSPLGPTDAQSRMDLEEGTIGNTPPLANLAARARHEVGVALQPRGTLGGGRHSVWIGASWGLASLRNQWSAPSNLNLITAGGAPASVLELNTPLDSHSRIQAWSAYVQDHVRISPWLGAEVALNGDFARGNPIAWYSISPRVGLTFSPPLLRRLTLRGSYARLYAPLAGRYLDYGNANSLGGAQHEWRDANGDGIWQPSETGPPLMRFGGPYSSIDSGLRRPYADEFNLGAEAMLPLGIRAQLGMFRRDEKNRLAAVNVGVPASAFSPVEILDPGAADGQTLTVYAQDPATLGQDRYLLTNPPGLRMMNQGLVAEVGGRWRSIEAHTSFMAVKSQGATNPGNAVIENDSGVVGALLQDPNTLINAVGRTYFDRAYVGKVRLSATLPAKFGRIVVANTADYLDGLVFGRRLLVTGLPQGPFLVAATVRGSPEGGHRAEYVLNWNLRVSRTLSVRGGSLRLVLDVFNVPNLGNKVQEVDASGPLFTLRLPVAIQSPRFVQLNIAYDF